MPAFPFTSVVIPTYNGKALLATCDGTDFEDRRDTAILSLFLDSGIRRAEIAGLRVDDVILEFGLKKPAFRIVVNTPTTHGSIGLSTGLDPAMTLGCGGYGGNITSDNISPRHLLNIKRLAYETSPAPASAALDRGKPADQSRPGGELPKPPAPARAPSPPKQPYPQSEAEQA
jgi:hypothetical protein